MIITGFLFFGSVNLFSSGPCIYIRRVTGFILYNYDWIHLLWSNNTDPIYFRVIGFIYVDIIDSSSIILPEALPGLWIH